MAESKCLEIYVCAPSSERSGNSHAITLGRYLSCFSTTVDGAKLAFAVDGTPADSVMLALNSPIFEGAKFDLVVSGINRGDNCGLHVIYSGTVGAAREAACKGIPAVALSLANHGARSPEAYDLAARISVSIIKAVLGLVPGPEPQPDFSALREHVLNVNFPPQRELSELRGLALTRMGRNCVFPAFKEIAEAPGPHLAEIDEHTAPIRMFRNYAGEVQEDHSEGSDMWAVRSGLVAVTPLSLFSDVPVEGAGTQPAGSARHPQAAAAAAVVTRLAATDAAVPFVNSLGVPA